MIELQERYRILVVLVLDSVRFRNAAICDFIPLLLCDFSAGPVARVAIFNLRFENMAVCDCDSLGR